MSGRDDAVQSAVYRALHNLVAETGGVLDPNELAKLIVERAREMLGVDSTALSYWDQNAHSLVPLAQTDAEREALTRPESVGQELDREAMRQCAPIVVEDVQSWQGTSPRAQVPGAASAAAIPLLVQNRPIGALTVGSRHARRFDDRDVELLSLLGTQLGPALEAAQLYSEAVRRRSEIARLADLAQRYANEAAERAECLAASEAELRALFAAMTDVVMVLDREGRIVKVAPTNPTFALRPPAELIGNRLDDLVPADRLDDVLRTVAQVLRTHETVHVDYAVTAHGQDSWFDATVSPLTNDTVFWVARDITDQKRSEDVLHQREEELILNQRMESVGRLAGGIAHDFNNLLTVIIGFGELLREQLAPEGPAHSYIDEIVKAGQRAEGLTQQLLAFSRRQVLAPAVLDVNTIIADMHTMLRSLIGEDIELTTVLDLGLGRVRADATQLQQVILNLAANARDAMPTGGTLTIQSANMELDEDFAREHPPTQPGSYVMLTVTDTGEGMDAETQAHVFEPFFTTKERGKGTGLGLATVYGIVKQSEGYIWLTSAPGQGTTFTVHLPRVEEETWLAPPAAPLEAPAGTETILVAEDEAQVRMLVEGALRAAGYTVLVAALPTDALRLAAQHAGPVHLLLTDLVMPGMSGREVAERITAERHATRVLYMSGYTDDVAVRHGIAGAAFLAKPFSPAALARKVREVLDG